MAWDENCPYILSQEHTIFGASATSKVNANWFVCMYVCMYICHQPTVPVHMRPPYNVQTLPVLPLPLVVLAPQMLCILP